ncbi:MAG: hypothetical protein J5493_07630 [Lachnospiraceae bacterium]|nr:hypothetical protein [Lachnospiraceae bacterium]
MNLQEIFLQVLKISLSASVAVGLVMLLRFCFRKAPRGLVCALWLLVAVRLLIWQLPESKVSVVPAALSSGSAVTRLAETVPEELVRIGSDDQKFMKIVERREVMPQKDSSGQSYVMVTKETFTAPKTLGERYLPALSIIWAAGSVVMLLYMIGSYLLVWRRSRLSVHLEGNVWFCDEPGTPFVFGLLRPRIYIPSGLSDEDQACVLAHEKAHIARKDPFWKLFGFLLLSLNWFNPILWISYILLGRDIEKACDERAIRDQSPEYRKAYSSALLALSAPKHWISACPTAFGEVGIKERVKAALRYKKPGAWIVTIMIIVSLFGAGCALTNPSEATTRSTEKAFTGAKNRYKIAARESDSAGDGWVVSFIYEDYKNYLFSDDKPSYRYQIDNIRHWDDSPAEAVCFSPYQISISGPRSYQDTGYTENTEGLERDLAVIEGILMKEGTKPEDLLSLGPASIEFEVLDKDQFFRLMRTALTATPRWPERQRSFDGPFYGADYFREREFLDGYVFRFALLECWGFMDEVFIDVAYGSADNFVLLSDLVEEGKATPEQQEAYALLRQISESLKGREFEPNYNSESYKDKVIGEIDFGRLYDMTNDLMNIMWPENYYLPRQDVPGESMPVIEWTGESIEDEIPPQPVPSTQEYMP